MKEKTLLGYVNKVFDDFEIHFQNQYGNNVFEKVTIGKKSKYIAFLSVGNPSIRARVYKETSTDFSNLFSNLCRKTIDLVRKNHLDPQWIKIDLVINLKQLTFEELEQRIAKTRRNYFRSGIAFDPEFRLAFLEQEINGNAMIRSVKKNPLQLHEKNINHYLNYNSDNHFPFIKKRYQNKPVYLFNTISAFKARDNVQIYDLYNGELTNGIRKVENIEIEVKELIEKSTYYLVDQLKSSGQFEYGYFSAFAKRIGTYNILRHSSSLYSLVEGYEVVQDNRILSAVEKGIDYLIREAIVYKNDVDEDTAFVVDHTNLKEIKLGSNATAILAMTKYMEITKTDKYLKIAQALARGIIQMKTLSGGFMHVLTYPTFEIKDLYRIIYYEGEAVFSLLRLYAIDKKELWLSEVKKSFDYFIANDYWKHHDHWLSYATNELTIYEPKDKYFIFGLKNCQKRLDFIYHRETTYPTFLELTMAAYKMVDKIKELNKEYLLEHIDECFLKTTIDYRAEYQRVGFFYPELAMYKKDPSLIINSFFIRHHSFRVRIDDVEHYLSGYCQYLQYRFPKIGVLSNNIIKL